MNIIKNEMFVTPVWEIDTGFDSEFNINLLKELNKFYHTQPQSNSIDVWQSNTTYISRMKKYILDVVRSETISEVSKSRLDEGDIEDDIIYFHDRGWLNYHLPGQHLSIHGHGNVLISATYYIDVPENSGDLLLIDPRGAVDWDIGNDGCHGSKFNRIKPKESKMVFFPGYILHTVEKNLSKEPRISLTSNINTVSKKKINSLRKSFE
jgi:uncharacterized protein (TIGR02466 family)